MATMNRRARQRLIEVNHCGAASWQAAIKEQSLQD
jgi:hypothetical protein